MAGFSFPATSDEPSNSRRPQACWEPRGCQFVKELPGSPVGGVRNMNVRFSATYMYHLSSTCHSLAVHECVCMYVCM